MTRVGYNLLWLLWNMALAWKCPHANISLHTQLCIYSWQWNILDLHTTYSTIVILIKSTYWSQLTCKWVLKQSKLLWNCDIQSSICSVTCMYAWNNIICLCANSLCLDEENSYCMKSNRTPHPHAYEAFFINMKMQITLDVKIGYLYRTQY